MPLVELRATKDTWISSRPEWREQNNATSVSLKLHRQSGFIPTYSTRILLQFDLSLIAPGSTINSAGLALDWMNTEQTSASLAECFKMSYDDWLEACNFYTVDGLPLGESNGWPGSFRDPDVPRNYASNDFDPATVRISSHATDLGFPIRDYIPDALSLNAGILSILIQVPTGNSSYRNYRSRETTVGWAPKVIVDWTPPSYVLTLTEGSNGSCTASPDQPAYQEADVVTLTVTPDAGYAFDNWSGADAGDVVGPAGDGTYTITMDADKAIQCNFVADTFKLTLNEGVNGADTLTPNGAAPPHTYEVNEEFISKFKPDAGFQLDQVAMISGDPPKLLANTGQASDGYEWITQAQKLMQNSEWTSSYKALWTLTTNIVGGANGTVSRGSGVLTWPQEPLYAFVFPHIVRITPNAGYQATVSIDAGTIIPVELTPLNIPAFGFDASDWLFTVPDSDATLTVTWVLIAAGQSAGGMWQNPWDKDRGRNIL